MKRVKLALDRKSVPALITSARIVHEEMTAHAEVFTNSPVDMTEFSNAIGTLQTAAEAAILGGKSAKAFRNGKRLVLCSQMRLLASYVEMVANGDVDIIYLAGMEPVQRGPRRYEFLEDPMDVRTKSFITGTVKVSWKKVAHASYYVVEYCEDPNATVGWHHGAMSRGPRHSLRTWR